MNPNEFSTVSVKYLAYGKRMSMVSVQFSHRKIMFTQNLISETWDQHGKQSVLLTSGQDGVMVDLVTRYAPQMEIVFIDTGYHFPETLETIEQIEKRYNIRIRKVPPVEPVLEIFEGFCCSDRKVEQMNEALDGKDCWMTGVRNNQSDLRKTFETVSTDKRGLAKISPLLYWNDKDIADYINSRDIIQNPLIKQGYLSVGCAPCTSLTVDATDPRSGRWAGLDKTECGIQL